MFFSAFSFTQTLGGILYLHPSKRAQSLHLPPTSSLLSLSWARRFPGPDLALWAMKMEWNAGFLLGLILADDRCMYDGMKE
jgi:hypothetical protein